MTVVLLFTFTDLSRQIRRRKMTASSTSHHLVKIDHCMSRPAISSRVKVMPHFSAMPYPRLRVRLAVLLTCLDMVSWCQIVRVLYFKVQVGLWWVSSQPVLAVNLMFCSFRGPNVSVSRITRQATSQLFFDRFYIWMNEWMILLDDKRTSTRTRRSQGRTLTQAQKILVNY